MGNCFVTICKTPVTGCCYRSVLRVVKIDGKVLEFKRPVLVKDVPVSFSGCGIGESRKATEVLDGESELRLGRVYYVVPCKTEEVRGGGSMKKRIKVVITKQQLEDLLSEKVSVEEVIGKGLVSPGSWKPGLESIPE